MAVAAGVVVGGKYRVERVLSEGGMGALYVARHEATGKHVALKLMRAEIVQSDDMRRRFAQEAQVASIIKSKYVVDVYDAGIDEASAMPFLVMELLDGQDLAKYGKRRRLPPDEVVGYLEQAARGLDKAHAAGVVHRDLKPENLFRALDEDGAAHIKILDFGIAKILGDSSHQTQSTAAGGTAMFMAPEQTRKGAITPAADIWSLGLIAYKLLVGRAYWEGDSLGEVFRELLSGVYPPPSGRAAAHGVPLPAEFDAWFARSVAWDPAERFARAGEAIAALRDALGAAGVAVAATIPSNPPSASAAPSRPPPPIASGSPAQSSPPAAHVSQAMARSEPAQLYTTPMHAVGQTGATPPPVPVRRANRALIVGGVGVAAVVAIAVVAIQAGGTGSTTAAIPGATPTSTATSTSTSTIDHDRDRDRYRDHDHDEFAR